MASSPAPPRWRWRRRHAQELRPLPGVVRLSANENPYGPSPKALAAAAEASARGAYYPGPIAEELLGVIAERHGLSLEHMVLSSGSNEALCAATVAWGKQGRVVVPALTYTPHLRYAEKLGTELVPVALKDDMSTDLEAMAAAVDDSVSLVYVCNPNNPTGIAIDGDELRAFCRTVGKRATVLVDEAYNELTDRPEFTSMVDLVRAGENVIVMRTFSKIFGLAGLRIGYVMARPDLATRVADHVMSWPNGVGIAAALASYTDEPFITFSRAKILEGRAMVTDVFERHGLRVLPSQTNFVYADIRRDATEFARQMLERGVRIRGAYKPYDTWSRVSMGKLEDLEVFGRVFHEVYTA
ncbi:MAG: histidinol-phosphate transaminase [Pseudomonadales bacterium]